MILNYHWGAFQVLDLSSRELIIKVCRIARSGAHMLPEELEMKEIKNCSV